MKRTRVLLMIVVLNCVVMNISFTQWVIQNSGTQQQLRSISFIDPFKGWAVGDSGIIVHTVNGGVLWEQQSSNTLYGLNSVSFCDSLNGWCVGDGGMKLMTSDGGQHWIRIYHDTASNVKNMKVQCFDPKTAVFSRVAWYGDYYGGGTLFRWQKDGGILSVKDWFDITPTVPSGFIFTITDFEFVSRKIGFVIKRDKLIDADWGPQVSKTVDGGLHWVHSPIPATGTISFSDSTTGWLTTRSTVYECSDSSASFHALADVMFYPVESVHRLANTGYISSYGSIMKTTDGGKNWSKQIIKEGESIRSIQFITSDIGWVAGTHGLIAHTKNGGVTSVNNDVVSPSIMELYQNYPNPFNPSTNIEYSIPRDGVVSLRIYDGIGREVAVLVDEFRGSGDHIAHWNASRFSSGVYVVKLQFGHNIASKRILLIK